MRRGDAGRDAGPRAPSMNALGAACSAGCGFRFPWSGRSCWPPPNAAACSWPPMSCGVRRRRPNGSATTAINIQRRPRSGGFFRDLFGPYHQQREYQRYRRPAHVDHSRAPPPQKRAKDAPPAATTVVVMGDGMAGWLAYGLEDAFSDTPSVEIVRKDELHSGLIRYKRKSDLDWWHVARDILSQQKANYVVMMLGLNDRENIRESDIAEQAAKQQAEKEAAEKKKEEKNGNKDAAAARTPRRRRPRRRKKPSRSRNRRTPSSISAATAGRVSIHTASTRPSPRSRARACRCSGSACRRSAAKSRRPTPSISTTCSARAPSAPASSISMSGTASSTTAASIRTTGPTMKARCGGCVPPTACSSPNTARASSRIMSSARSAVI